MNAQQLENMILSKVNANNFDPKESQELINCQRYGIDNQTLSTWLENMALPEFDNGCFEVIQSIVHYIYETPGF